MINQLYKRFIKDYKEISRSDVRQGYGMLASIIGIISNVFLFIIKILVGTIFNSISIMADAVNNLSDAGSSVITLVGFKLSSKPADCEHPYGHARAEYVTGFTVSIMIVLLGFELVRSSYEKIITPNPINFNYISMVVLIISILVKLWQTSFNRKTGEIINSEALIATGTDSRNDVIATTSVLIATIFSKVSGIQIDGYMGVLVAIFIIYSGIKLIGETLDPLLGAAPDAELVEKLGERILSYEGVLGFHDLIVHSYGPMENFATVHVEVCAHHDLLESHDMIDIIERELSKELNANLVIHMDPIINDDKIINDLRQKVENIVVAIDSTLTIHDFRVATWPTHSNLIFDISVPSEYKGSDLILREQIQHELFKIDHTYYGVITLDRNYTSTTNAGVEDI